MDINQEIAQTGEVRVFLEEICCDLCRFEHLEAASVSVDREVYLGVPRAYADIRVAALGQSPYFVEVKLGYSSSMLMHEMRRKYQASTPVIHDADRVVLVVRTADYAEWPQMEQVLRDTLSPHLRLEVWDEPRLLEALRSRFNVEVPALTEKDIVEVRLAVENAKANFAFEGAASSAYIENPLGATLLWHFGFWELRHMFEQKGFQFRDILPPGKYEDVVVIIADLCAFSSYVRDSSDELVRYSLTSFYSKSRYQVIHHGGMLYQFVGDEVIALFGVPQRRPDYVRDALRVARALIDIGDSVSNEWQRQMDRMQTTGGVHVGVALGDLQILSLRPFSRVRIGAVGDPINVASRLGKHSAPGEIVISNSIYSQLDDLDREQFCEKIEPVEAKNIGKIQAWRFKR